MITDVAASVMMGTCDEGAPRYGISIDISENFT